MSVTLQSTTSTYLSVAEFLKRADTRVVQELCSDTGTPVTSGALTSDPNLAAALLQASGDLEMAVLRSQRISQVDLNTILTTAGAAQATLYSLLADLTLFYLYKRRVNLTMPEFVKDARERLKKLQAGEDIFPTVEHAAAGVPSHQVETAEDVQARNGTTYQTRRFFGRRSNRWMIP